MLARLMKYEPDKLHEVMVPVVGDAIYVYRADAIVRPVDKRNLEC